MGKVQTDRAFQIFGLLQNLIDATSSHRTYINDMRKPNKQS